MMNISKTWGCEIG